MAESDRKIYDTFAIFLRKTGGKPWGEKEMLLDEKLLQIEQEKIKREEKKKHIQEIREEFLRQEREQKSVQAWMEELKKGKVSLHEKEFLCETITFFDENIPLYVFPEDVARIIEENHLAIVAYRELEIGTNLTFLKEPLCVENEIIFQQKLSEQYKVDKITYYPMNTGKVHSSYRNLFYAAGIMTSAVGGIWNMNYYYQEKNGIVMGNYTCPLVKRFFFEHLFVAMLHGICGEG